MKEKSTKKTENINDIIGRIFWLSKESVHGICFIKNGSVDFTDKNELLRDDIAFTTKSYLAQLFTLDEAKFINEKFPELNYSMAYYSESEDESSFIEPVKFPENPLKFKMRFKGVRVSDMEIENVELDFEYKPLTDENQKSLLNIFTEIFSQFKRF